MINIIFLSTLIISALPFIYSEPGLRRLLGQNNYTTDSHLLHHDHSITDVELFYRIAASIHPTSDKITVPGSIEGSHYYAEMYGSFMFPYILCGGCTSLLGPLSNFLLGREGGWCLSECN